MKKTQKEKQQPQSRIFSKLTLVNNSPLLFT